MTLRQNSGKENPGRRDSGHGATGRRGKWVEYAASFGLLMICASLVAPFINASDLELLKVFKWVYSAGALMFVGARVYGAVGKSGSPRMRRLYGVLGRCGIHGRGCVLVLSGGASWKICRHTRRHA